MDQQPTSSPDQPPREDIPSVLVEQSTQPATPPVVTREKKSNKRALIMAIIGLLIIAAAVVGYLLYSQATEDTTKTDTAPSTTGTTADTPLEQTTKVFTDGANSESGLMNSDDSSDADDASNSASNVGDSINENNL